MYILDMTGCESQRHNLCVRLAAVHSCQCWCTAAVLCFEQLSTQSFLLGCVRYCTCILGGCLMQVGCTYEY